MSDLLLMTGASGLPRQGLCALYDPYRDAYGLTPEERALLQTAKDYSGRGVNATYGSTAGADANDPSNTGLAFQYDGVDDAFTGTPSGTVYSYVLAGDAYGIGAGWVRGKRTNVAGRVYLALFYDRRLTEAEYARLWLVGRQYLASRGFTGTAYNEAWPIPCTAGVMDFGLINSPGHLWVFPNGTTSTVARPAPTLASAGTTWLYCADWGASTLQVADNNTDARYVGSLKDLPRLGYYLDLYNCANVTGSLADLPRVTYYLNLYSCSNVTGTLADLPRVTYYLGINNCSKVTGTLADLPRVTYYLGIGNCTKVTGTLADLPRVTYYLSLYGCSNVTGSLADLPRVTYTLSLYNCSNVTGTLADLPRVTYTLSLYNCSNVTGSLADAPRVSYYLDLYNCSNVTGSLADAPRVSYLLSLYNCPNVTGSLADAPRVSYWLDLYNCTNVTGTLDGTWAANTMNLKGIGWSTSECDQTLINFANGTLTNKSLTISAGKRSSASDSAKATLISRGWTVTES